MTTVTTMTAPAPAHLIAVTHDGFDYRAGCSCGWASDAHDTPDEADTAGADHMDEAIRPPDPMDRLMSALLDIQDDLAAVVMWLAENWSAHLPPLGWHSNGSDQNPSRPAVTVQGYGTPDEVVDAAALLGVEPADDPAPNTYGARYRRAVRRFGRVNVEVFTDLNRATEPTR